MRWSKSKYTTRHSAKENDHSYEEIQLEERRQATEINHQLYETDEDDYGYSRIHPNSTIDPTSTRSNHRCKSKILITVVGMTIAVLILLLAGFAFLYRDFNLEKLYTSDLGSDNLGTTTHTYGKNTSKMFSTPNFDPDVEKCLNCFCPKGWCKNGCDIKNNKLHCGYFQMTLPYYKDCGMPDKQDDEDDETGLGRCANDMDCAKRCVVAYKDKYAHRCQGVSVCEQMSRLRFGGPAACQRERLGKTDETWKVIKECLETPS